MELRVLEYFLAVAREGNITSAARSLHLSQPTLSVQLKALEEEVGHPLLIRGTRGVKRVELTEEGRLLRQRAEEILSLVYKTKSELSQGEEQISGEVYIGAAETYAIRFLSRAAMEVRKKHPNIIYHISSGNAELVFDQMERGMIDFGVVFGNFDRACYDFLKMPLSDQFGILMRKDAPLSKKGTISPEDLHFLPLLLSHQEQWDGWPFLSWIKKDIADLHVVATYTLLLNAAFMVEEGMGYAVTLDHLVPETETLTFRPLFPPLKASAYIIWKRHHFLSKASGKLLEAMKKELLSE